MSLIEWTVVVAAGLLGGALNAVAGGGSFITLPALIICGVPPVAANATGTAALLPGYIASAWRYRKDATLPPGLSMVKLSAIALIGGVLGACVLLLTSDRAFLALIPWLMLLATAMFAFSPKILALTGSRKTSEVDERHQQPATVLSFMPAAILFAVCIYGGYFNGGLGIILLAAFGLMGQTQLHGMNGLKNYVSALLTAIAVVIYALGGALEYRPLLVMAVSATLGGYLGAHWSYRLSQPLLRRFIVATGLLMAVAFFLNG